MNKFLAFKIQQYLPIQAQFEVVYQSPKIRRGCGVVVRDLDNSPKVTINSSLFPQIAIGYNRVDIMIRGIDRDYDNKKVIVLTHAIPLLFKHLSTINNSNLIQYGSKF